MNGITNATIVACDSGRFAERILRNKVYTTLDPVGGSSALSVAPKGEVREGGDGCTEDDGTNGGSSGNTRENVHRFGGVLVDPPRCGLDAVTLELVSNYADIVYVSCNPSALARDLSHVSDALWTCWTSRCIA